MLIFAGGIFELNNWKSRSLIFDELIRIIRAKSMIVIEVVGQPNSGMSFRSLSN